MGASAGGFCFRFPTFSRISVTVSFLDLPEASVSFLSFPKEKVVII